MPDKKFLILLLAGLTVIMGSLWFLNPLTKGQPYSQVKSKQVVNKPTTKMSVGGKTVFVYVADTNETRMQGLSGTKNMPEDVGMLFVFPYPDTYPGFWMKDMNFPLDFIWINNDKIVDISENIQAPAKGTLDADLEKIVPKASVDTVLEVNAGFVSANGIKIGDKAVLETAN